MTNGPARALYATLGYAQVGRRRGYYARAAAPPVDALVLAKPLADRGKPLTGFRAISLYCLIRMARRGTPVARPARAG